MTPRGRRTTLLALLVALAAVVLLAAGLPRLRLGPGMPLPAVAEGGTAVLGGAGTGGAAVTVNRAALAALLALLGAVLVAAALRALRAVRWRGLVRALFRGLVALALACGGLLVFLLFAPQQGAPLPEPTPPPAALLPRTPLGSPPPAILWAVAAAAAAVAAGAAALLVRREPGARRGALQLLGLEAERAREALLAGGDALGVVVACYARMGAALAEARGVERPEAMTAREFEGELAELGLPRGPVHELTRLFEAARYGGHAATPAEEARALACLSPIVDACRAAREEG